jgi:hypothetical protein
MKGIFYNFQKTRNTSALEAILVWSGSVFYYFPWNFQGRCRQIALLDSHVKKADTQVWDKTYDARTVSDFLVVQAFQLVEKLCQTAKACTMRGSI